MWEQIITTVDNSAVSAAAGDIAIQLAKHNASVLHGVHVFDFAIHRKRFGALMPHLSAEYQKPKTQHRLEARHDSVMDLSFSLLGESFLLPLRAKAEAKGIVFNKAVVDGRPADGICQFINQNGCELVVMGRTGQGKSPKVGGCARKVMRRIRDRDFLLVKNGNTGGKIIVGIDGSDYSFNALKKAIALAECFGSKIKAVAVFDLALHETIFNSMKNKLSDKAERVFGSEKQEQLHEEVVDRGIKRVYAASVEKAKELALQQGVEIETAVLPGRAEGKIVELAKEENASFVVFSRFGLHKTEESDLGAVAEVLIAEAPCSVLCCK